MSRFGKTLSSLATAAALFAASAGASVALEIRYNIFDRPGSAPVRVMEEFFEALKKETGGSLTAKMFVGGQLLNAPATLKGVGDGVVGGGFVVPSLNQGQLKHLNVVPDLLPFVEDPWVAAMAGVSTATLDCKECVADATSAKVVWLGGIGPDPWHLMCREPVTKLDDLKGRKVRVTGASPTRLIRALGAVPVQLAPNEIPTAMQGGQIDCACGPTAWLRDLSLREMVKTVVAEPFGVYGGLGNWVFNKRMFDGLNTAQKTAMLKLIPVYVVKGTADYQKLAEDAVKEAKAKGVAFWPPDAAFRKTVDDFRKSEIKNLAADMAKRGVKEPEKIIRIQLDNLERWKKTLAKIGKDRNKLADVLREEVYAKVIK
ncbi:MAG: TRAP transporter substrate-binding protein DctP [Beijerinckiaceae bacterium]